MTRPIRGASALLVSAIALATIASTALAGAPSDRQVLATAPPGASLTVGDIDAARDTVAVVWHEQRDAGPRSFLRFGDDDGSFGAREALGGTRNAVDPRVAICEFLWTSVTRKTRSGPRVIVETWTSPAPKLFEPYSLRNLGHGKRADIACRDSRVAVAWFDTSRSPAHLMLRTWVLTDACADSCDLDYEVDLGRAAPGRGVSVAIGSKRIYVSWMRDTALRFRSFTLPTGSVDPTPNPAVTLADSPAVRQPYLAAQGRRAVLAHQSGGDTVLRSSRDHGATFDGPFAVWQAPCTDCEAGSRPTGADMSGSHTLVEAFGGTFPDDTAAESRVVDAADYRVWRTVTSRDDARQVGALVVRQEGVAILEAWDDGFRDVTRHRLRYQETSLP